MRLDADILLSGTSTQIRRVATLVSKVALVRSPVVILGECGTGTSTLAAYIHARGPTKSGQFNFVLGSVNAKDLRETLNGSRDGSVFFEHVTHLDNSAQRILADFMARAKSDGGSPRVLASTEVPLSDAVREGLFANDLYYHLSVVEIALPALHDRLEDIHSIVPQILTKLATEMGLPSATCSDAAIENLCRHSYPGNLIELSSMLEHALAVCEDGVVAAEHLPKLARVLGSQPDHAVPDIEVSDDGIDLDATLDCYERILMEKALTKAGGNRTAAAKLLGVSFRSMRYRLAKLGMDAGSEDG